MNLEHKKKIRMTMISPKTVKCSPMQLRFPQGPDGSLRFFEVQNGRKTPPMALQPIPMAPEC